MTHASPDRSDPVDTPWQACPGLRAGAIDGAASMIVMEVLVDALSRLPQGRAALDAAVGVRAGRLADPGPDASPTEIAAGALALALIDVARRVGPDLSEAA